jgi:hypothetical protein
MKTTQSIKSIKKSHQARSPYGITTNAFFGEFGRAKFGSPTDPITGPRGMPKFDGMTLAPTATGRWRYTSDAAPKMTVAEFQAPILRELARLGIPVKSQATQAAQAAQATQAAQAAATPKKKPTPRVYAPAVGRPVQLALF